MLRYPDQELDRFAGFLLCNPLEYLIRIPIDADDRTRELAFVRASGKFLTIVLLQRQGDKNDDPPVRIEMGRESRETCRASRHRRSRDLVCSRPRPRPASGDGFARDAHEKHRGERRCRARIRPKDPTWIRSQWVSVPSRPRSGERPWWCFCLTFSVSLRSSCFFPQTGCPCRKLVSSNTRHRNTSGSHSRIVLYVLIFAHRLPKPSCQPGRLPRRLVDRFSRPERFFAVLQLVIEFWWTIGIVLHIDDAVTNSIGATAACRDLDARTAPPSVEQYTSDAFPDLRPRGLYR